MGHAVISIHVQPHIRRYLLTRLSQGERLLEPTTQDLIQKMSTVLGVHVLHAVGEKEERTRSRLDLAIRAMDTAPHFSKVSLEKLNGMLEELYRRHGHLWMDWLMETSGAGVTLSLTTWRARYGVTETDQPFETARRAYARHREKCGKMLPHGGARFGARRVQGYRG